MNPPPDPTPRLSLERAAAIIRGSLPSLRTDSLTHLGSGWSFDAFLTGDGWVFRFPHDDASAALLDSERRLQSLLGDVLPPAVAVPRIELMAGPSEAFPYRFAGHRFVRGTAADAVAPALLPVLARQLGEVLGAIHAIPQARAHAAGLAALDSTEPGRANWVEHRAAAAFKLRGADPLIDRALDWLSQQMPLRPNPAPPLLCVTHNDLSPEHLLVDPATGDLTGIIDWSDAILGDPARDFVPLVVWCGWAFAEEVLRSYPGPVDPEFRERLRHSARVLALLWPTEMPGQAADVARRSQWVRNAFGGVGPS